MGTNVDLIDGLFKHLFERACRLDRSQLDLDARRTRVCPVWMLRPAKLLAVLLATFALVLGQQVVGVPAATAVDPDPTTTTLTITPAGQAYAGQVVTFDVTVTSASGAAPTGFVAISTGGPCGFGSPLEFKSLTAADNGQLTFTHTFDQPFGYQFQACYFPEGSPFAASESAYQQYPILADATTTSVVITPTGSQYAGGLVTFDVTVTTTSGDAPTGLVAISTGGPCGFGSPLETQTLTEADNGQLTITHTFDQPFGYQFQACYFPGAGSQFGASESQYQEYPIVADATTTTLVITPTGSQYAGGLVTFAVTVTTTSGDAPTGHVAISTGGPCGFGSPLEISELTAADNGQITFTHTFDQPFGYQFQACYFPGTGSRFGESESAYQEYPIVADATTTTLTITPTGSQLVGELVTFDVTVTSTSGAAPTGFVAISTGGPCGFGSPLEFSALTAADNGQLTFTHTFDQPYGYQFQACYFPEDSPFGASESEYQEYPIVAEATTTSLVITPTGSQHVGGLVTFDVTVTTTSGAAPTGVVAIQTGGACGTGSPLDTRTLTAADGGALTITRTFTLPFDYQFQACYFAEDTSFGDSGSGYQEYAIVALVPPEVTLQPDDVTAYPGDSVSFTAGATGRPDPTVQWQVLVPGGTWTNIPGATSTTLTFTDAAGQSGNQYRAVFSNGAPPDAITDPALLTLRYGFLGFSNPIPKSKWAAGRIVPVKFAVVDRSGAAVPTDGTQLRVQLWSSPTGGVLATAGCTYDAGQYGCNLRLPSNLTRGGTYYIAAQISVAGGPWALLDPVTGARTGNPIPIRIR
jgi:hypothetical protein